MTVREWLCDEKVRRDATGRVVYRRPGMGCRANIGYMVLLVFASLPLVLVIVVALYAAGIGR